MVIKNVLLAEEHGLGNGETPIFPIHIFKVKEGVNYNPGDPNYDLFKLAMHACPQSACSRTSAFIDAPFNLQYYKPGDYRHRSRLHGLPHQSYRQHLRPDTARLPTGRGNLSVHHPSTSRALPSRAHGDIDKFYASLDKMMDLVVDQLPGRGSGYSAASMYRNYPFLMGQGVWIDSDKLGSENDERCARYSSTAPSPWDSSDLQRRLKALHRRTSRRIPRGAESGS